MALIQCKECGHMISDRAVSCPIDPINGQIFDEAGDVFSPR